MLRKGVDCVRRLLRAIVGRQLDSYPLHQICLVPPIDTETYPNIPFYNTSIPLLTIPSVGGSEKLVVLVRSP
jgi:hypothetical protein